MLYFVQNRWLESTSEGPGLEGMLPWSCKTGFLDMESVQWPGAGPVGTTLESPGRIQSSAATTLPALMF